MRDRSGFHKGYSSVPTIEFTWALILASARHIVTESNSVRSGGWQQTVGTDLRGKTLGVLGLRPDWITGRAQTGELDVNLRSRSSNSSNMTPEAVARSRGRKLGSSDQLFERMPIS